MSCKFITDKVYLYTDGRTGGQKDRRTGGQENWRTEGQEDRRTGGQEKRTLHRLGPSLFPNLFDKHFFIYILHFKILIFFNTKKNITCDM